MMNLQTARAQNRKAIAAVEHLLTNNVFVSKRRQVPAKLKSIRYILLDAQAGHLQDLFERICKIRSVRGRNRVRFTENSPLQLPPTIALRITPDIEIDILERKSDLFELIRTFKVLPLDNHLVVALLEHQRFEELIQGYL